MAKVFNSDALIEDIKKGININKNITRYIELGGDLNNILDFIKKYVNGIINIQVFDYLMTNNIELNLSKCSFLKYDNMCIFLTKPFEYILNIIRYLKSNNYIISKDNILKILNEHKKLDKLQQILEILYDEINILKDQKIFDTYVHKGIDLETLKYLIDFKLLSNNILSLIPYNSKNLNWKQLLR